VNLACLQDSRLPHFTSRGHNQANIVGRGDIIDCSESAFPTPHPLTNGQEFLHRVFGVSSNSPFDTALASNVGLG
jgi:hypothetical protein